MANNVIELRRHDLHEGDVARAKSGGPLMLVSISDAEIDDLVMCVWVERRRLKSERFRGRDLICVARGKP